MAGLGGVTRTSKRMSHTFSWRSSSRDTSQHARLDLLEGPHTLGDVLEDVRLVLAAPSTRFYDSRPHPTRTSLSGSEWLLGLLVADTSLDVHSQAIGEGQHFYMQPVVPVAVLE